MNAGGGFIYVGAMHDSFPMLMSFLNGAITPLPSSTGRARKRPAKTWRGPSASSLPMRDELGVDIKDYSLWGGSAGARMAAYLGSYGPAAFGGNDLPRPGAVIMEYTGHSDYTKNDPPTFAPWLVTMMASPIGALCSAG